MLAGSGCLCCHCIYVIRIFQREYQLIVENVLIYNKVDVTATWPNIFVVGMNVFFSLS